MDKRADFLSDLGEVKDEMQDVGNIIAAAKTKTQTKTVEVESRPTKSPASLPQTPQATPAEPSSQTRPTRVRTRPEPEALPVLLNVTTRISRDTNEALTEASLHQRLKKLEPASRQDIIEQALCEWLSKRGYARKAGVSKGAAESLDNKA